MSSGRLFRGLVGFFAVVGALVVCRLACAWGASTQYPPLEDRALVADAKTGDGGSGGGFRSIREPERTLERLKIIAGLRNLQRTSAAHYLDPYRRDMKRCDELAGESARQMTALRERAFMLSPADQELEAMLDFVYMCMDCTPGPDNAQKFCGDLYPKLHAFH